MTRLAGDTAFGAMTEDRLLDRFTASAGAVVGIAVAKAWRARLSSARFRQLAPIVGTGPLMLWQIHAVLPSPAGAAA